jgi:hypothetical protein
MNNEKIIQTLSSLAQIDLNAAAVYETALQGIDVSDTDIRDRIDSFRDDHCRHWDVLARHLSWTGGVAPDALDETGRIQVEKTRATIREGTFGALKALFEEERLPYRTYSAIAAAPGFAGLPENVRAFLLRYFGDEMNHLSYIETKLKVSAGAR